MRPGKGGSARKGWTRLADGSGALELTVEGTARYDGAEAGGWPSLEVNRTLIGVEHIEADAFFSSTRLPLSGPVWTLELDVLDGWRSVHPDVHALARGRTDGGSRLATIELLCIAVHPAGHLCTLE